MTSIRVGIRSAEVQGGGGEWQPGMQDLHIDGTSPFRNFFEIKDESTQDAVCDAFEELLADPLGANLQSIANRHGVAVVGRLRSASAVTDLHIAMDNLEMRIRGGQSMRLLCRSWPNRCGGDAIIKIMKRRLRRSSMIFEQDEGPCTMCDIDDEKDNEDDENMNINKGGNMQAIGDDSNGGEGGSSNNDSIQIGDSSNEAADDKQHASPHGLPALGRYSERPRHHDARHGGLAVHHQRHPPVRQKKS